jgi:hypothetical protein
MYDMTVRVHAAQALACCLPLREHRLSRAVELIVSPSPKLNPLITGVSGYSGSPGGERCARVVLQKSQIVQTLKQEETSRFGWT